MRCQIDLTILLVWEFVFAVGLLTSMPFLPHHEVDRCGLRLELTPHRGQRCPEQKGAPHLEDMRAVMQL